MKQESIYKEVEKIIRERKLMEKKYKIVSIKPNERVFTTSMETDIWEMISDGMSVSEIVSKIEKW